MMMTIQSHLGMSILSPEGRDSTPRIRETVVKLTHYLVNEPDRDCPVCEDDGA